MEINLTLIGEMITFIVFIWVAMKYIWPPITKTMEARQQKIADGLAAAERGKQDLALAQEKVVKLLGETRTKSDAILSEAERRASEVMQETKAKSKEAAIRIQKEAENQIAQAAETTKKTLREEAAMLALQGLEKILPEAVDANTHEKLLREAIKQIEASA